jgi:hypothetical protein
MLESYMEFPSGAVPVGGSVRHDSHASGDACVVPMHRSQASASRWSRPRRLALEHHDRCVALQAALTPGAGLLAVSEDDTGLQVRLRAGDYDLTGAPTNAAQLLAECAHEKGLSSLALAANGAAALAWQEEGEERWRIGLRCRDALSGRWRETRTIDLASPGTPQPQLAVNALGEAIVVWQQSDGLDESLWASRYDVAADAWRAAAKLPLPPGSWVSRQRVVLDERGNAIVVWEQFVGGRFSIRACHYDATHERWGTCQSLESDEQGDCWRPKLALTANGHAVAVWYQSDVNGHSVWVNRYDSVRGRWAGAQQIPGSGPGAIHPHAAIDAQGDVVVVWKELAGAHGFLASARYDAGRDAWCEAGMIAPESGGEISGVQVAIHRDGRAVACWQHVDGGRPALWVCEQA